jgi:hypothetical protein
MQRNCILNFIEEQNEYQEKLVFLNDVKIKKGTNL